MDPSKWECSICYNILVDPVVGRCGHDFCKQCLAQWRGAQLAMGRPVLCPLCRTKLDDGGEGLAVCLRLKEMVEHLFPQRVEERRAELKRQREEQQQQGAGGRAAAAAEPLVAAGAQGLQAAGHAAPERPRRRRPEGQREPFIRVRRTRRHPGAAAHAPGATAAAMAQGPSGHGPQSAFATLSFDLTPSGDQAGAGAFPGSLAGQGPWQHPGQGPASQLQPHHPSSIQLQLSINGVQLPFFSVPTTAPPASAGGAGMVGAAGAADGPGSSQWVPPANVSFTMGWFEPLKDARVTRLRARRMANRR